MGMSAVLNPSLISLSLLNWTSGSPLVKMTGANTFDLDTTGYDAFWQRVGTTISTRTAGDSLSIGGTVAFNTASVATNIGVGSNFITSIANIGGVKGADIFISYTRSSEGLPSSLVALTLGAQWQPAIGTSTARSMGTSYGINLNHALVLATTEPKNYTIATLKMYRSVFTATGATVGDGQTIGVAKATNFYHFIAESPILSNAQSQVTTAYAFFDAGQTATGNGWGLYSMSTNSFVKAIQVGGTPATGQVEGTIQSLKAKITPEGGYAILLTAGETLSKGNVVYIATADENCYKTPTSGEAQSMPIGVVYADATATNPVWVVVTGRCEVLPVSTITAVRGNVLYTGGEAGRVDQSSTVPVNEHWRECGHWLKSGSGNGALTFASVHFN